MENTDQKNSEYGHFSHSEKYIIRPIICPFQMGVCPLPFARCPLPSPSFFTFSLVLLYLLQLLIFPLHSFSLTLLLSVAPCSFQSHLQHNSLDFALLRWLHPASIYFYKVMVGNKDTRTLFRCLTLLILTNVTYCSGVCIIFYEQVVSAGQNAFSNRISNDF